MAEFPIVRQREEIVRIIQRAAAPLLLEQEHLAVRLKPDRTVVTEVDLLIQEHLKRLLAPRFPGWLIVGEEDLKQGFDAFKQEHPDAPYVLIDPIDGTGAFIRGLTGIPGVNVAFVRGDDRPELAVFWQPGRQRTYVASADTLWINGRTVRPPAPPRTPLAECYLYASSDVHRVLDLSGWEGKLRALGSTGCHLAMLLDGTTDPVGVLLTRYKKWDVTGLFHLETAGYRIHDLATGAPLTFQTIRDDQPVLAAAPAYADRILNQVSLREIPKTR